MGEEVIKVDKQRVEGAIDQAVGSAKSHVGEWTGNGYMEAEGDAQQIKGKVETSVGKLKDAVRAARDSAARCDCKPGVKCQHREDVVPENLPLL